MAGFNSFDFSRLFFNPASVAWQLGSGISAPVFNRGAIRAAYETVQSNQRIAWTNYEQVVFRSYVEVLDLINQLQTLDEQLKFKSQEVAVQKRSVDNSNTMFSVGYANYLEVINAQARALQAQVESEELQTQQLQNKVNLYKALGRGWF
jgi:outer membrane protein, multidrug efflux system